MLRRRTARAFACLTFVALAVPALGSTAAAGAEEVRDGATDDAGARVGPHDGGAVDHRAQGPLRRRRRTPGTRRRRRRATTAPKTPPTTSPKPAPTAQRPEACSHDHPEARVHDPGPEVCSPPPGAEAAANGGVAPAAPAPTGDDGEMTSICIGRDRFHDPDIPGTRRAAHRGVAPVTGPAPASALAPAAAPDAPPPAADTTPAPSGDSQVAAGMAPTSGAGPVTAAAPLVVQAVRDRGFVVLLVLLVLLFLALHGRVDGGDPKLGAAADRQGRAGFR